MLLRSTGASTETTHLLSVEYSSLPSLIVRRFTLLLFMLVLVYIGSYTWFRSTHVDRWDRDGLDHVMFPQSGALYYFYRPLTCIDARLTDIRFHIGPHR